MKTVAYYRSSTERQETSVPMQQGKALSYAQEHFLVIDQEFSEPGVSARKVKLNDRERMMDMLREIKQGKIKRVILYKRDRLARRAADYMEIYQVFKEPTLRFILLIPVSFLLCIRRLASSLSF